MPSFQTLFRVTVMVAVGVVGVKGWHLYGPTNEQVKTRVTHCVELVRNAVQSRGQATADALPDPRNAPGANEIKQPAVSIAPAPPMMPPAALLGQTEAPKLLSNNPSVAVPSSPAPAVAQSTSNPKDRLAELISRLQKLGAADTNLAPWGSDGRLYRFSCRAPLANAPAMTQHFESVAEQPAAAVEQVLAKVEAWQVAQRDGGTLRY